MNIAILYTGEERTLEDTLPYFKKNILLNDNVHVYCIIQTKNYDKVKKLIDFYIGTNLKSLEWFDNNDLVWRCIQSKLLENINIGYDSKNYLRSSGSMVEYYQLWLAYVAMTNKENTENFKYDYIIRNRTDIIVNKPIDFKWLELSNEDIIKRLEIINNTILDKKSQDSVLNIFMNTLIDFKRVNTGGCNNIIINKNSTDIDNITNIDSSCNIDSIDDLKNYIKSGKYIITIRANLFYIAKRELFTFIPAIGTNYGTYKSLELNDYWWNSESQFRQNCMEQLITIFDSTSNLEELSLYSYNKDNYFNDIGVKENSDFICFIKRN
jgi:hypothetical protein